MDKNKGMKKNSRFLLICAAGLTLAACQNGQSQTAASKADSAVTEESAASSRTQTTEKDAAPERNLTSSTRETERKVKVTEMAAAEPDEAETGEPEAVEPVQPEDPADTDSAAAAAESAAEVPAGSVEPAPAAEAESAGEPVQQEPVYTYESYQEEVVLPMTVAYVLDEQMDNDQGYVLQEGQDGKVVNTWLNVYEEGILVDSHITKTARIEAVPQINVVGSNIVVIPEGSTYEAEKAKIEALPKADGAGF